VNVISKWLTAGIISVEPIFLGFISTLRRAVDISEMAIDHTQLVISQTFSPLNLDFISASHFKLTWLRSLFLYRLKRWVRDAFLGADHFPL
jgi:hypothetical protein